MKMIIGIMAMLLPALSPCQPAVIKSLTIGDTVPDIALGTIVNYSKPSATLSDFKGKLVILDFWATWCGYCVKSLPKMEALQKEFGDKIQVLAVAYENKEKITGFFNSKAGRGYHVTSVVNDSVLGKLFPHDGIPHCIWIDGDGKVKTITGAEAVTANNIRNVLSRKEITGQVKRDLDPSRPLFLSDFFPVNDSFLHYSILTKGWFSGLLTGTLRRKKGKTLIGQASTNSNLLTMYTSVALDLFRELGEEYCEKRTIVQVADMSKIWTDYSLSDSAIKSNLYNYDLIVPEKEAGNLYHYMLEDLNRYTDYTGKMEKRLTRCLVLVRTDTIDRIKTSGAPPSNTIFDKAPFTMTNYPVAHFVGVLNSADSIRLPVIDETYYTGNIDIQLSGSADITVIRSKLKHYGLDLIEASRLLNMFVLTDKKIDR